MEVIICDSYETMSRKAAKIVAEVVDAKPNAVLGLDATSSALGLYRELIRMHKHEGLDFSRVTTFNLAEYVNLAPDDPRSCNYFIHENFLDHINTNPDNVHAPLGLTEDLDAFCKWYEQRIKDCGGIDVQILEICSNGRFGFHEPGSSTSTRTRVKTLTPETRQEKAELFGKIEDVPIWGITMGFLTLIDAKRTILLANGEHKADIVAKSIEGPFCISYPAGGISQDSLKGYVFLDEQAASQLKMKDYYKSIQASYEQYYKTQDVQAHNA